VRLFSRDRAKRVARWKCESRILPSAFIRTLWQRLCQPFRHQIRDVKATRQYAPCEDGKRSAKVATRTTQSSASKGWRVHSASALASTRSGLLLIQQCANASFPTSVNSLCITVAWIFSTIWYMGPTAAERNIWNHPRRFSNRVGIVPLFFFFHCIQIAAALWRRGRFPLSSSKRSVPQTASTQPASPGFLNREFELRLVAREVKFSCVRRLLH
jgi:hypothetical protein